MARKRQVAVKTHLGLFDAFDGANIPTGGLVTATNLDYYRYRHGQTRNGHSKFNTTRYEDSGNRALRILGIASFPYSTTAFRDILWGAPQGGGTQGLYYVDSGTLNAVTLDSSITAGSNEWPMSFININNAIIGLNQDTTNWVWDGSSNAYALGIAKPGSASTVADGGAGNLSGTFEYKVAFKDSGRGTISAFSPVSAQITVSSKQITVSSIPVSTDGRVDKKVIVRRSTNQSSFFKVTEITNATVSYTDNTASIGDVILPGGQPPLCRFGAIYNKGTLLLGNSTDTDGSHRIYYSNASNPEEFKYDDDNTTGFIDLGSDGGQITGMAVVNNQAVIFLERKIMHLTGETPTQYQTQVIEAPENQKGMPWAYAWALVQERFLLFARADALYVYDLMRAEKFERLGKFPPQGYWDDNWLNIDTASTSNYGNEPQAYNLLGREQVWFGHRTTANAGRNDQTLVFHYGEQDPQGGGRTGRFTVFDFGFDAIGEWRQNFSDKPTVVFATEDADGYIMRANNGTTDRGFGSGTTSGTATGGTATTLTDTGAAFPITGDGLLDQYITVWRESDSSNTVQTKKITANTATEITVASWDYTPAASDTYAVGAIKTQIQTGELDWGNSRNEKALAEAQFRLETPA